MASRPGWRSSRHLLPVGAVVARPPVYVKLVWFPVAAVAAATGAPDARAGPASATTAGRRPHDAASRRCLAVTRAGDHADHGGALRERPAHLGDRRHGVLHIRVCDERARLTSLSVDLGDEV